MKPKAPRRVYRGNQDYEQLFRRAQDVIQFSMPADAESEVLTVLMRKAMQNGNPIFRETMAIIAEAIVHERVNNRAIGML